MQNSELELKQWLKEHFGSHEYQFTPLPGDASFRTYYRVRWGMNAYIAMLAPPHKECTHEFVSIAKAWHNDGLCVPEIFAWEKEKGFVLLSDFGDTLLLDKLTKENVDAFYIRAMSAIILMQSTNPLSCHLPPYNKEYAYTELSHFQEWFVSRLLGAPFSEEESTVWQQVCKQLLAVFCQQPQVTVHRDFHSRNLMVLPDDALGIIDFQDAMVGPITYDMVSLLKDCYITWPQADVERWISIFYERLKAHQTLVGVSLTEFIQWFDWVGLQRHLKVLGIFSRLKLRDNKSHYLQHMPRIMQYLLEVTHKYENFSAFHDYLQHKIHPLMTTVLKEQNVLAPEVKVA